MILLVICILVLEYISGNYFLFQVLPDRGPIAVSVFLKRKIRKMFSPLHPVLLHTVLQSRIRNESQMVIVSGACHLLVPVEALSWPGRFLTHLIFTHLLILTECLMFRQNPDIADSKTPDLCNRASSKGLDYSSVDGVLA